MQKKKHGKNGFTLVELLVVIAVLAVLTTVSVVGYTTFIEKAYASVDVQTLEQLNLVLIANEQSGNPAKNVKDAYNQVYESGLSPMYVPQSANTNICWDSYTNRFVLYKQGANANQGKVVHSSDEKVTNGLDVDVNNDNRFFVYTEPALCQHQWDDGEITLHPTCTEQGNKILTCKICDTTQEQIIDANGHSWNDGEITTQPTCESNGERTFTCAQCNATSTEVIDPTGHSEIVDSAKNATCTTDGMTEGKHCNVCQTVTVPQETIPAVGHTEEIILGTDATCTETGLKGGIKCSVCQETILSQEIIPALGHTTETIPAVNATCSQTGLTEGTKCSVCGEILVVQTEVSTIEHNFTSYTSNNDGTHQSSCSSCDQSYNETCEIVGGKCKACNYSPKTFSVYNAGAVSVENGTYTTNYAIEPSANNDNLYGTLSSAGTVVYKLNANLNDLNFNGYFSDSEVNGSTIYLDLNGCSISGTLSLSAKNFNLYVFDSSETKGTIGRIAATSTNTAELIIWNVEITNANTYTEGGGIYANKVNVTIYSGSIHNCFASDEGGGIYVNGANLNIYDGKIFDNSANIGAGVYVSKGTVHLYDGEIYDNTASTGGGVWVEGNKNQDTFVMNGGYIYGNGAVNGGGIYVKENILINGGTILGNIAQGTSSTGTGGGIYHSNGTLTIDGGTIGGANPYVQDGDAKAMANSAKAFGAEIYSNGIINFTNGTMYLHEEESAYSLYCNTFSNKGGEIICQGTQQSYFYYVYENY